MSTGGTTNELFERAIEGATREAIPERLFRAYIEDLTGLEQVTRVLEIGGGRAPALDRACVTDHNLQYTVNDISQQELNRAPGWVDRWQGDIAAAGLAEERVAARYDLIFSRMVFEHLRNPAEAYRNLHGLLAPGGVAINLIPTLYASPFVANRLLPERVAAALLSRISPHRNPDEVPKFPAYYRWATSTSRTREQIKSIGFEAVAIIPIYGHDYYRRLPPLHAAEQWWARQMERRGRRSQAAYAFVIATASRRANN